MLSLQAVVQVERCAAGQPLQESLNLQVVESLALAGKLCFSFLRTLRLPRVHVPGIDLPIAHAIWTDTLQHSDSVVPVPG